MSQIPTGRESQSVLIVGAGPVGLTLAIELARYGVPFSIVDRAPQRGAKSKALAIWSRTLELFDRAACADLLIAGGNPAAAANIFADGHKVARVTFDGVDSPHPYVLMIPQSDTERLLESHLESLGQSVRRGVEVTAFEDTTNGVRVSLHSADGQAETRSFGWLVGCDGAHSFVRHKLGLSFEGKTLGLDWLLADVHLSGLPVKPNEMVTYLDAEGPLVIFPISSTRYRVIACGGTSHGDHPADPTLEGMQAILDRRGPSGVAATDPIWLSGFRINERKVASYRQGRVFLAGDAAHVHSPAGGQGMNTGMQDAFNLGWKLALVCWGTVPDALLDSYDAEREPVARKVLSDAGRMTSLSTLRNPIASAIRNFGIHFLLGLESVGKGMAETLTEINIHYPHSPLNGDCEGHSPAPVPGQRWPPSGTGRSIGSGSSPRFAVAGEPTPALSALLRKYDGLLENALRAPRRGDGIWLIRPDGYVACAVAAGSEADIDAYLERICA
jgi:2-polyprenyl-6-methoxyphenol hydroxylase-like FAD-dependent oxidoreductase